MDLVTLLKFAGILVSGALGVLGTVTETRDKKTHRLTTWGRYALWLTVTGFAVAFGAQVFETLKQKSDAVESRQRTEAVLYRLEEQGQQNKVILTNVEQQAVLARQSVAGIERVISRFEAITADLTMELPASAPEFEELRSELSAFAQAHVPPHTLPLSNITARVMRDGSLAEIMKDVYWVERKDEPVYFGFDFRWLVDGGGRPPDSFPVDFSNLSCFHFPPFWIGINASDQVRPPSIDGKGDEVYGLSINLVGPKSSTLHFDQRTKAIYMSFRGIESRREWWGGNGKVVSINDLSKAHLTLQFTWGDSPKSGYADAVHAMKPAWLELRFDRYVVSMDSFERFSTQINGKSNVTFSTTLPAAKDILNGKTSKSYPLMDIP